MLRAEQVTQRLEVAARALRPGRGGLGVSPVTQRLALGLSLLALSVAGACRFDVDPDQGRFRCASAGDCGEGFECHPQRDVEGGACFPAGTCGADETCNGADDDCDGVVDDDVTGLSTCLAPDQVGVCAQGSQGCEGGAVVCLPGSPGTETCNQADDDCDALTDEDWDLTSDEANCGACGRVCEGGSACVQGGCLEVDCGDGVDNDADGGTDCADLACSGQACSTDASKNCGRQAPAMGSDAGTPACLTRETQCANGLDDDGDGQPDCPDEDCDGLPCGGGNSCLGRTCG